MRRKLGYALRTGGSIVFCFPFFIKLAAQAKHLEVLEALDALAHVTGERQIDIDGDHSVKPVKIEPLERGIDPSGNK